MSKKRKKISWRTFAELDDDRASFAEKLSDDEIRILHLDTKLDTGLLPLVEQGFSIYLTGNPGDGKTHIIKRYENHLHEIGAFIHLDASAHDEEEFIEEIRKARESNKPTIVAINEGPLRRLVDKLPEIDKKDIRAQLGAPFEYSNTEPTLKFQVLLVNMGTRQVLDDTILEEIFKLIHYRVDFSNAPSVVQKNVQAIALLQVRERLLRILRLLAHSGIHITMHELLGFFSFIITGGKRDTEQAEHIPSYYDLIFIDDNPLHQILKDFDPAYITHPMIDMAIWDGDPNNDLKWLESPQDMDAIWRMTPDLQESTFHSRKRRFYFEGKDGQKILEMMPEDRRSYFGLLSRTQASADTAKSELLDALAYFFGDPKDDEGNNKQFQLWTGLRYEALGPPTTYISSFSLDKNRLDLKLPKLNHQVADLLEYEPDHFRMVVKLSDDFEIPGLDIDLGIWLSLMKIKRGMPQRYHDPLIGRRLEDFMSRITAKTINENSNFVDLQIRNVESGNTYRISVSVENKRYVL